MLMRVHLLLVPALTVVGSLACSSSGGDHPGLASGAGGAPGSGGAIQGGSGGAVPDGGGGSAAAVADGGSNDTWASFAQGFFATYCVSCHGASDSARDFRTIDHVRRDAALIRCGIATTKLAGCGSFPPPRQFPIGTGAKPDDAARDRLLAWLDAGLPE